MLEAEAVEVVTILEAVVQVECLNTQTKHLMATIQLLLEVEEQEARMTAEVLKVGVPLFQDPLEVGQPL